MKINAEIFLEARDLYKRFHEIKAVDGISFTVNKGEIFGLLGPNGAGKTTTIRILATVLKPDQGDVIVGGYAVSKEADRVRSLIGVCPQELALFMDLSAFDNLMFFGQMAGLKGKEAKVQALSHLESMGLKDRAGHRVSKFSGGMKRRVNLAVALMGHPRLLFLDEPTVGIDPQSRNNIHENIRRLQDGGMTILYTTHYMDEADKLCNRVAIIDAGKILALAAPRELKERYGTDGRATLEDVFLKITGHTLRD